MWYESITVGMQRATSSANRCADHCRCGISEFLHTYPTALHTYGGTLRAHYGCVHNNTRSVSGTLHFRASGTQLRSVVAAFEMMQVHQVLPAALHGAFFIRISVGYGLCTVATLSAGDHRFFVVGGNDVNLATNSVLTDVGGKVKCGLLITPSLHSQVLRYTLLYTPSKTLCTCTELYPCSMIPVSR